MDSRVAAYNIVNHPYNLEEINEAYSVNQSLVDIVTRQILRNEQRCKNLQEDKIYVVSLSIEALGFAILNRIDHISHWILGEIKNLEGKNKGALTLSGSKFAFGLTLSHLCAIANDVFSLTSLKALNQDINAIDSMGWTPLHHAALLSHTDSIIKMLRLEAKSSIKTRNNGSYLDIVKLIRIKPVEDDQKISLQDEKGFLTARQFRELTGAHYVEDSAIHWKQFINFWKMTPEALSPYLIAQELFKEFKLNRINHRIGQSISPSAKPSTKPSAKQSAGLGVFATKDLDIGVIIGEYCGVFGFEQKTGQYQMGLNLDGEFFGNEMSRINDGFPNARFVAYQTIQGAPHRYLCHVMDFISKGEEICIDYGSHNIKVGPYQELRPMEARRFIKENSFDQLKNNFESIINGSKEDYIIALKKDFQFRYILQTPAVLFNMVLDRTLEPSEASRFLFFSNEHALVSFIYFPQLKKTVEAACLVLEFVDKMKEIDSITSQSILETFQLLIIEKGIFSTIDHAEALKLLFELLNKYESKQKNNRHPIDFSLAIKNGWIQLKAMIDGSTVLNTQM